MFKLHAFQTPLEEMVTIADAEGLFFLGFADSQDIDQLKFRFARAGQSISQGKTPPIESIERELNQYFAGKLRAFQTLLKPCGTPFQKNVWDHLQKIPYGTTSAYAEIAQKMGKPTAYRAVAQANGANPLAIIIPCHRVINTSGALGGYSAGLERKKWLLDLEAKHYQR